MQAAGTTTPPSGTVFSWQSSLCWVSHDGTNPVVLCASGAVHSLNCYGALQSVAHYHLRATTVVVVGPSTADPGNWAWCTAQPSGNATSDASFENTQFAYRGSVSMCRPTTLSTVHTLCVIRAGSGGLQLTSLLWNGTSQTVVVGSSVVTATSLVIDDDYRLAAVAFHYNNDVSMGSSLLIVRLTPLAAVSLTEYVSGAAGLVVDMTANTAERFLLLVIEQETSVTYRAVNFFGVYEVTPSVVDFAGSMPVTLHGAGFPVWAANSSCTVGTDNGTAYVTPDVVVCSVTRSNGTVADGGCAAQLVDVYIAERQTVTTYVGVLRPSSAMLLVAGSGDAVAAMQADTNTTVWLTGIGFFPKAENASCRVVNQSTGLVIGHSTTAAAQSTGDATCDMPELPMTPPGSVVEYAHDGVNYGAYGATLAIVGPTTTLQYTVQDGGVFRAGSLATIPAFLVRTADFYGNLRGMLEDDGLSIRCSSVDPPAAMAGATEIVRFADAAILTAAVVNGSATFAAVTLAAPTVGPVVLHCFLTTSVLVSSTLSFLVVPGAAVRLDQPAQSYVAGVISSRVLQPPVAATPVDSAGNSVVNASLGIATLQTVFALQGEQGSITWITAIYTSAQDNDGQYRFEGVTLRTVFGQSVQVSILVEGLAKATLDVPAELCG